MDRIAHFIHWNISTKYSPKSAMDTLLCESSGWRLPCLQQCNTVRVPHAIPCIIVFTPRHATPLLQEYIPHHLFSLMACLSCIKSIDDFCRSQLPFPAVSLTHTYSHTVNCCLIVVWLKGMSQSVIVMSSQAFICRHGVWCRDMSLVMSPTQQHCISARVSKRHDI